MPSLEVQHIRHDGQVLALHHHPEPGDGPAVLVLPAMGAPAGYYTPLVSALAGCGLAPSVLDLRGHGASTPPPARGDRTDYRALSDDVSRVIDHIRSRHGGRPVVALGHSLGGQLAVLHLARGGALDALVLVAVGLPYWRSYRGVFGVGAAIAVQGIGAVAQVGRVWPGWGFGGRQAAGTMRDWARTARTGTYLAVLDDDESRHLAQLSLPVLAVDVEHDRFTPPPTTTQLLRLLPSAEVTRWTYTDAHAGTRLDHMRWVRASGPLAQDVAAHLQQLR
jgi:predicted alpha/beta hydrolase